jgi:hypothetical protein
MFAQVFEWKFAGNYLLELCGEAAEFSQMSRTLDMVIGIVGLVFAAGVVGFGFFWMLKRSYDPGKILVKWAITIPLAIAGIIFARKLGPFGPFVIVFLGVIFSVMWTPHIGEWLAKPIADLFDGGNEPPDPKPLYSTAHSKRKFNKLLEAIMDIRQQLAKFPNDFEGIMLLANIQAVDMKDLQSAEVTLNNFCNSPGAPPKQIAAAWTQLADWYLQVPDMESARVSLEKIIAKFPDSQLSLAAAQRIAHLGSAEKIILGQHDRQKTFLPEGVDNIGLLASSKFLIPEEIEPGKLAAAHVKHLETHPHDTEVREKLAVLYAEHFHRLDLATMELEQMINEPQQSPKHIAHCLNVLANLQINCGATIATVRETLEQIVTRFPDLPVANLAQNRLARIELEFKGKKETTAPVKMGVYEQDIGLKYGAPKKSSGV